MRNVQILATLLLAGCGGGGSDYVDMVPPAALELRENFGGIAVADFNSDGLTDIAVGTNLTEDRRLVDTRVSIFEQRADSPGSFLSPRHFDNDANDNLSRLLVAADCQRNGLPDLFVANWNEGGFRLLMNDTAQPGTLLPSVHYDAGSAESTFGRSLAIGDIDADGFPDIVVATDDTVRWFPQNAGNLGTYMPPRLIGEGRKDVQVGDINGDGVPDVVTLGADGDVSESFLIHFNNTNSPGQFLATHRLNTGDFADYVGVADYDSDGRADIAVGMTHVTNDYSYQGLVSVFRQIAPGVFIKSAAIRTNGMGTTDVFETADLDGEEFPALVFQVGSEVHGSVVQIMELNAAGALSIQLELAVPVDPDNYSSGSGRLSIGDLNNDALNDIVLIHKGVYVFFRRPGAPLSFDAAVKLNSPL